MFYTSFKLTKNKILTIQNHMPYLHIWRKQYHRRTSALANLPSLAYQTSLLLVQTQVPKRKCYTYDKFASKLH